MVAIGVTFPRVSNEERFIEALSPLEILDIRKARALTSIAAFDVGNRNVSGGDRPERVLTGLALTDPFGPFGLAPALGRGFTEGELQPRGPNVAILSHRLWQGRFGGDPAIVGSAVHINGVPTTVVGVMPPELLLVGIDLWIPWGRNPLDVPRNSRQFTAIGRLAPGATHEQANAELAALAQQTAATYAAQHEEYDGLRLTATPWVEALHARPPAVGAPALGPSARPPDRMREPVQPAAGAIHHSTAGNGRPPGTRCGARRDRPPPAGGGDAAGDPGRSGRGPACVRGPAGHGEPRADATQHARRDGVHQRARPGLGGRAVDRLRLRCRAPARVPADTLGAPGHAQGERPRHDGGCVAAPAPARAGRFGDRPGGHAARRGRAVAAQLRQTAERRARVRTGERADHADHAAGGEVPR